MSFLADKWEKEVMPIAKLKTLRIKIYPTLEQKKTINKFIDMTHHDTPVRKLLLELRLLTEWF
jgi:hypothetical protein